MRSPFPPPLPLQPTHTHTLTSTPAWVVGKGGVGSRTLGRSRKASSPSAVAEELFLEESEGGKGREKSMHQPTCVYTYLG